MNTERELTIDELDAVSGGAGAAQTTCMADVLTCAFLAVVGPPTSGGGLVHEPIHAK
jgi:bacteriocin-like protein